MKKHPTTHEVFFNNLPACPEQDALETQFFQRVLLANGTFKTTSPNRLDDLNAFALPYLQDIPDRPLKIMDIAASSGVSTLEWYGSLRSEGIDCDITASDILVQATLLSTGTGLAMLVDRHQNILHMDIFGIGIIGRAKRVWKVPVWAVRTGLKSFFKAKTIFGSKPRAERVALLTKRFSEIEAVRMIEDDLSQNNPSELLESFHVIRAANILNRAYFPAEVIARMIDNIKARLKVNGLLIVCRTELTGVNDATLFRATASGGFERLASLNNGSEVDAIVERGSRETGNVL